MLWKFARLLSARLSRTAPLARPITFDIDSELWTVEPTHSRWPVRRGYDPSSRLILRVSARQLGALLSGGKKTSPDEPRAVAFGDLAELEPLIQALAPAELRLTRRGARGGGAAA